MTSPVERFLAALRARGIEPRRAGDGWACRCPAHDDHSPSLSLCETSDGAVLMRCHAGCETRAVVATLGLKMRDLFPPKAKAARSAPKPRQRGDETPRETIGNGGSVTVASVASGAPEFATAREAVEALERRHGPRAALWTYHDRSAEPVGRVIRWDLPDGRKSIRPVARTPDGSGWRIGGMTEPRPLYGVPELLASELGARVFVVEGEKAADAARTCGLLATTSAHGNKSAPSSDWSPLASREVVILPDHDEAGERYAEDVARLARAAGARSVRIVRLAEVFTLPEGGDLADVVERARDNGRAWAASHGGTEAEAIAEELKRVRESVEGLAEETPIIVPEAAEGGAPSLLAFKSFPTGVLPEPVRSFVAEGAAAIGCDESHIALPLLAGLASAIGNTHRIELKRGWAEPAIVWTAIVAESGSKKSPPIDLALGPIRKRQHHAMNEHAELMREYTDALAIHERDAAQWRKSKSNTAPPAKPEAPVASRYWTDDATTEALAVLLQQNPRGLLVARDELAGWFAFDAYKSGKGADAPKWLEMHGGRPLVVDRKSGGMLYVPHASVSITGSIQPDTLRRVLGQEHRDNGMAARLLFAEPPRRIERWTESEVNQHTEAALAHLFDRLYALTPDTDDDGNDRPRLLRLTPEGKAAWVRFYNEHAAEQAELSGDEAAAWSKLEGYAARFALVIHMARGAAGDSTLRDPVRVDEASIAAGVTLSRWFGHEAKRVYSRLGESDEDAERRLLVAWISRKGGAVTVRDLARGPKPYRSNPERARAALSELVDAGVGAWEWEATGAQGGRPPERFRLL